MLSISAAAYQCLSTTVEALALKLEAHACSHLACRESMLTRVWLSPVRFYRRYLSALKGHPTCRYLPTCSEYAIEAVQSHGVIVGTFKAVGRLLRCNPLFSGGYDPVRAKGLHRERCKD